MYITTHGITDAPEFRATLAPHKNEPEPRMHLALGDNLAIIVTLPELRQLADVIGDALEQAIEEGHHAEA
jgi:hypothetical protein